MKDISPSAASMTNEIEEIDKLPRGLRDCVHEFGWSVVRAFMDHGISKPASIRFLVHTVWLGSREPGNKRGASGGNRILNDIDDMLIRCAPAPSARTLIGLLREHNFVVAPREARHELMDATGCSREDWRRGVQVIEEIMWPFLVQK